MRISQKLLVTLTSLLCLTLGSFLTVVHLKNQFELNQLSSDFGQSLAEQVALVAAEPLFAKDLLSLNVVVSQLQTAEHLAYAAIVNTEMRPLAEVGRKPSNTDKGYFQVPIRFQANKAGYAIVAMDQTKVGAMVADTSYMLIAIAIIMIVISGLLIAAVVKHIVDGLKTTTYAFGALAQGQLGTQISIERSDELGQLIQSFNELSKGLETREQLLNPQTTQPMAAKKDTHLSNGYIHITQMVVDLSEISRHIDKLSPDGYAKLLNVYHQIITIAAHHYDCDSCRFDSEGISIRFLASDQHEAANACLDAICASQLALRLIDRLNQARFERHLPTVRVSIGLHHGLGFASQITNAGHSYTAFLSTVDSEASRLAKLIQKGRVAVTQSLVDTANAQQVIQLTPMQTQPMTDFHSEIRYATVSALSPQLRKPIQIQADELFLAIYPRVSSHSLEEYDTTAFSFDSDEKDITPA